jgi:hypothetical protein
LRIHQIYSNILIDQLTETEKDETNELDSPFRETDQVQPQSIYQQDHGQQQKDSGALMTPEVTPESQEQNQLMGQLLSNQSTDDTGWGRRYALAQEGEELDQTSNNARRRGEISS